MGVRQIDHTMTSQMLGISKTSTQMDGKIMMGCAGQDYRAL